MGLRKKKSLMDQASETVEKYVEQVRPQVESAVATARDKAGPVISDARDKAGPVIADARSKAAPVVADAKAKAAPMLADARAKAAPVIASGAAAAADKVAAGANLAAEKAQEAADKVAEAAQPKKKKGGKLRKLLLFTGLAAALAFVAKKLQDRNQNDTWQSSYTPTPAAPVAGTGEGDDTGGSSPDEALADQAEAPHPVTTPEEPAEVVDVDETKKST